MSLGVLTFCRGWLPVHVQFGTVEAGKAAGIQHPEGGSCTMLLEISPCCIAGKHSLAGEQQMERRSLSGGSCVPAFGLFLVLSG